MEEDLETYEDAAEPLFRGRRDEGEEEALERELLWASQFEFRDSTSLPGPPPS